jgi:ABC-type multidrug transport system fused ATPase/permease subunit
LASQNVVLTEQNAACGERFALARWYPGEGLSSTVMLSKKRQHRSFSARQSRRSQIQFASGGDQCSSGSGYLNWLTQTVMESRYESDLFAQNIESSIPLIQDKQDRQMTLWRCVLLLYRELSISLRRRMFIVIVAMMFGALAELVTIGAIIPFLGALFRSQSGIIHNSDFLFRYGLVVIVGGIAAAIARIWILWLVQWYILEVGNELSTRIFQRLIGQSYSQYVSTGSAQSLAAPEKLQMLFSGALTPMMQGAVACVLAVAIFIIMVWIQPVASGAAFAVAGLLYLAVLRGVRFKLASGSQASASGATARTKILQEALRSLRDILLHNSGGTFARAFERIDYSVRRAQAQANFAAAAPRFIVEGAAIAAIGVVALILSQQQGRIVDYLPLIGAMALGVQRLLPLLQQAYNGLTCLISNKAAILDTLALLHIPTVVLVADGPPLLFLEEVRFDCVSYRFPDRQGPALENVDVAMRKGDRIGITGPTGSGKSTFLDLLMGLLAAQSGRLLVDGVEIDDSTRFPWQRNLAHVPQAIYLLDDTIAANISFGESDADPVRIRTAAHQAQLDEFIDSLPNGFDTVVGDGGVRVSGGQRQRIAIARALYRAPALLVLDEATSALDDQVESAVMKQIASSNPDVTIIVAAHGKGALNWCDRLITLDQGRIISDRKVRDRRNDAAEGD